MITRRKFLSSGLLALGAAMLSPGRKALGGSPFPQFFFAQVRYRGGEWDPNPHFAGAIVEELELRTSLEALKDRRVTTPSDPDLFFYPFLYMAGKYEFEPFTPEERDTLRRFLTFGGFLFVEDCQGARGFGFDKAFRREMKKILPGQDLKTLPLEHSVYRSFYLLKSIGGRRAVSPYLEGITVDQWTAVIYSQNDLAGAWARDPFGQWVNECQPGGGPQRAAAFKTGINIIVYSLTADYKKDVVHHPFIQKRLNL